MSFRLKPKQRNIDVSKLEGKQIEYFCKTQVIDKQIILKEGKEWNQELADAMEIPYPFYFVVKKNGEYDVLSGLFFEPFLEANQISELPETAKSKECIRHFIKHLK